MSIFFLRPDPVRAPGGDELKPLARASLQSLVDIEMSARALRHEMFDSAVINDQAWLILQDLFAAHLANRTPQSKSVGQDDTGLSATTVLRYLDHLEKFGMVTRTIDPHDSRVKLVQLTASTIFWMEEYYAHLAERSAQRFRTLAKACEP